MRPAIEAVRSIACCLTLTACSRAAVATLPSTLVQAAGAFGVNAVARPGTAVGQALSDPDGFAILYRFGKNTGQHPSTAMTDVNRTLYGTTCEGGTSNNGTILKRPF